MATHRNAYGLAYSCSGPDSIQAFEATIRAYLAFDRGTGPALKALAGIDPGMPMGRILKGNFLMLMGVGALVEKARAEASAVLGKLAELEPREALHAEALAAWTDGSLKKATAKWDAIAYEWPRDILAIKLANFGHFYRGESRQVRDGPAAALDAWSTSDPEYSYLLSLLAFGHEECGDHVTAERLGRRAIATNPADPWGVHAVSHVLEATERPREGVDWIESHQPHWSAANNFRYHVAWHKALFRLEAGDMDGALADYDGIVYSEKATEYLDICNDASLLARLECAGVDVGDRWEGVATKVASRGLDLVMAFPDVHFILALASSGDRRHRAIAETLCAQLDEFARHGNVDDADTYRRAGAALGRAMLRYRNGHFQEAAELLLDVESDLAIIGGSNAQRDLFRELTAECLWRESPGGAVTAGYLAQRAGHRPKDARLRARYLACLADASSGRSLDAAKARLGMTS